jgi:hypothetical protein
MGVEVSDRRKGMEKVERKINSYADRFVYLCERSDPECKKYIQPIIGECVKQLKKLREDKRKDDIRWY